jgi:hypothetical protein
MEVFFMEIVVIVTALVVVALTSLFKNVGGEWPHRYKALLATVVSVVAAGVVTVSTGGLDGADLFPLSLQVYGAAQLFYHLIFHGTAPERALANVGSGTDEPA